jgi:hypothetical protein
VKDFQAGPEARADADRPVPARFGTLHYGHSMADIPPNEEILDLIRPLNLDAP